MVGTVALSLVEEDWSAIQTRWPAMEATGATRRAMAMLDPDAFTDVPGVAVDSSPLAMLLTEATWLLTSARVVPLALDVLD